VREAGTVRVPRDDDAAFFVRKHIRLAMAYRRALRYAESADTSQAIVYMRSASEAIWYVQNMATDVHLAYTVLPSVTAAHWGSSETKEKISCVS
jgi:uncharacterized membrane protein